MLGRVLRHEVHMMIAKACTNKDPSKNDVRLCLTSRMCRIEFKILRRLKQSRKRLLSGSPTVVNVR